ncbi:MAG: aminotransferase class III-fold pyridoxal phosphate-dependent enzyme [Hyphomicrobiaceae bacterium]
MRRGRADGDEQWQGGRDPGDRRRRGDLQGPQQPGSLPLIVRAEGIRQFDEDGNAYIDISSGPVVSNIGHGNAHVADAMARQARTMDFAYSRVARHQPNIDLAHRIASLAGPGFERVFLSSGGSEAIEIAVKFLRLYDMTFNGGKRTKVVSLMPSYHGGTMFALSMSGDSEILPFIDGFQPPQHHVPAPLSYRVPPNHTAESYARACADALEAKVKELGPDTVLAFFIEPVGGLATGCNTPTPEYFRRIREICTRHGIALVFDEILCGTGRTGKFLAAHNWPDALPDLVVMAKGLGSGYTPLGATLIPAKWADRLAEAVGYGFSHTYCANPVSCATGIAVLEEYDRLDVLENTLARGRELKAGLEALKERFATVGDVRGMGLVTAVELVTDKSAKTPFPADINPTEAVRIAGLKNGLIIYCRRTARGRNGDWFMVSPPMTITGPELTEALDRLAATLADFEAGMRTKGVI